MRRFKRYRALLVRRMSNGQRDVLFASVAPFKFRGRKIGGARQLDVMSVAKLTARAMSEPVREWLRLSLHALGFHCEKRWLSWRGEYTAWIGNGRVYRSILSAARASGIKTVPV